VSQFNLASNFSGGTATSYVFDGQVGTLDYAFASASLFSQVTGATEWGINSDEADALDYNLDFGRDPAIADLTSPVRTSDHDPVIVGLNLSPVDDFDVTTPTDTNTGTNTIAENATNGSTVGITASATDGDGTNNTVTYSLTDNAGGRFTINANTGVVTVVDGSLLDYETATSYTITVQAGSSDGSIATQTFTIVVSNVNEAPTIVAPVDFDVEFAENSTAVILDLEVEDPEENAINFVLAGADADLFTISDGAIVFNQSPDFEVPRDQGESNVYEFTVEVSDATNPPETQAITITVTNVNEAPIG